MENGRAHFKGVRPFFVTYIIYARVRARCYGARKNNSKQFKKGIDKVWEVWYYIGVAARKRGSLKKP